MKLKRWLSISSSSRSKYSSKESLPENTSTAENTPRNSSNRQRNRRLSLNEPFLKLDLNNSKISVHNTLSFTNNEELHSTEYPVTSADESNDEFVEAHETVPMQNDIDDQMQELNNQLGRIDSSTKVFGFENFGNTCYCNSVLQCLYNFSELRDNLILYPEEAKFDPEQFDNSISIKNVIGDEENQGIYYNNSSNKNSSSKLNILKSNNASCSHDQLNLNSVSSAKSKSNVKRNKDNNYMYLTTNSTSASLVTISSSNSLQENENENESSGNLQSSGHEHAVKEQIDTSKLIIVGRPQVAKSKSTMTLNTHSYQGRELNAINEPENNHENTENNHTFTNSKQNLIDTNISKDNETNDHNTCITIEERKKNALARGPVINIDRLLNQASESNMYNGLKDIFLTIKGNRYLTGVVSPSELIEILKKENVLFDTGMHQDAHEFLNFLLNELSEYIDRSNLKIEETEKTENFIKNIFQGTLTNKIRCLTCDNVTSRDEPFLDLPIEVKSRNETDIKKALSNYHQREMLNGSNKFYCDGCCGLQEAERIVGIKHLPKILSLHLKRFKYSEENNANIKLFNKITYPSELHVRSTFDRSISKKYELSGIIIHLGAGPQHGHYVAMCKTEKFGWLLYDDETVEAVLEKDVLRHVGDSNDLATAYILFYKTIETQDSDMENNGDEINLDNKTEPIDQYEKNLQQFISDDELLRSSEIRSKELMEQRTLNEVEPDNEILDNRVKRSSFSSKSIKRTSKLFGFKRKQ
ncbi:hypothetical protein Kpol_1018p93 [Vanderwaltozyma polyspora DSM 70294]|uniref:Ubiquitin carboxyl-terminal hydrolase n=1 Tax=Vanderwaltozyma polyspora (strain ATCC 22028 / DSM 70294 / BCRC 21397 / CBS 2163 / NBRC 10782 / NRRL Y-8283 / UCD 57-17) TaxID=436907 RepID=A7TDU0_VANPO|nr:uncharacterized protein Kpol_1018p93 [Vanderwaltozyma polyspora DSM 70294]EDO19560.1 hypothetical protein Kpol_1018p93 [Vanderwaltozyma polyspora DSM 70294]